MKLIYLTILLLISTTGCVCLSSCLYKNQLVPEYIYRILVGWKCLQNQVEKELLTECRLWDPKNALDLPCIKINERVIPLVLSDDTISQYIKSQIDEKTVDVVMECYRSNRDCVQEEPDGISVKIWQPPILCDVGTVIKFHIALLSISLIFGIPATFLLIYFSWSNKQSILSLHRNLLLALVFRSLFTLIIQSSIFLQYEHALNSAGCQTLAVFDTFSTNIVLAFWVIEVLYVRKSTLSKEEFSIRKEFWIGSGLSLLFTVIWIIVVATSHNNYCWIGVRSWTQWINDPLRIFYIILQLILLFDLLIKLPKNSNSNSNSSQTRRMTVYLVILTPIYILQFSLNSGQPISCNEPYLYILYLVDGLQCAITSILLCYINPECYKKLMEMFGINETHQVTVPVRTLDSLADRKQETRNDVIYSSIVKSESLQTVLHLQNKFKLSQKQSSVEYDGDLYDTPRKISTISQYYDAQSLTSSNMENNILLKMENPQNSDLETKSTSSHETIMRTQEIQSLFLQSNDLPIRNPISYNLGEKRRGSLKEASKQVDALVDNDEVELIGGKLRKVEGLHNLAADIDNSSVSTNQLQHSVNNLLFSKETDEKQNRISVEKNFKNFIGDSESLYRNTNADNLDSSSASSNLMLQNSDSNFEYSASSDSDSTSDCNSVKSISSGNFQLLPIKHPETKDETREETCIISESESSKRTSSSSKELKSVSSDDLGYEQTFKLKNVDTNNDSGIHLYSSDKDIEMIIDFQRNVSDKEYTGRDTDSEVKSEVTPPLQITKKHFVRSPNFDDSDFLESSDTVSDIGSEPETLHPLPITTKHLRSSLNSDRSDYKNDSIPYFPQKIIAPDDSDRNVLPSGIASPSLVITHYDECNIQNSDEERNSRSSSSEEMLLQKPPQTTSFQKTEGFSKMLSSVHKRRHTKSESEVFSVNSKQDSISSLNLNENARRMSLSTTEKKKQFSKMFIGKRNSLLSKPESEILQNLKRHGSSKSFGSSVSSDSVDDIPPELPKSLPPSLDECEHLEFDIIKNKQ